MRPALRNTIREARGLAGPCATRATAPPGGSLREGRMRYETFYDGKRIPVIGLGTWTVGGGMSADYSRDAEYVQLVQAALEMGYTHIDTAEMYGAGHAEELVGKAVRDYCRESGIAREELFVTTKVSPSHLGYGDVLEALERSLHRLGMDYVDLFLIHWPNSSIPLAETFRALNELVEKGSAKRVGVSNFDLGQLREACELSETPVATNQVEYNLLQRSPRRTGLLDYCREHDILLTAYEPLGKGRLMRHSGLAEIAERSGVHKAQLALAWLLRQEKVITIPMSASEMHLRENLLAPELDLSEETYAELDALS